jgi:phosphatidylglycerophosphate synthase
VTGPAGVAAVAATGVALLLLAALTARRPDGGLLDRDAYLDRWRDLHGGYDPRQAGPWVRGWLGLVHRVARPPARLGVQPDVVTLAALWMALAVLVAAAQGGRWPLLAAALLVVSGLLDNLDGGIAVLQRRTTPWGYVLDSVVDRLSDVLYLVALVAIGGRVDVAVAAGVAVFLLEYLRARAGNAGGDDVGVITVAERPTRVIVVTVTLLVAGVAVGSADLVATVGALALLVATLGGLGQLVAAVRRALRSATPGEGAAGSATRPAGG